MDSSPGKPPLLKRFSDFFSRGAENRDDVLAQLRLASDRNLIDPDALSIIEGALQMSDMQVREVMVPRAQMCVIHLDEPMDKIADIVVETAHSRFPAVGENKDDVVGILLAKDLLRFYAGREFDLRGMLRPAVFVPESKRLNVLLGEFRVNRNHMAIVVDEYGGVAGLVTIEDVLEQIVGDIEDEHDFDELGDSIRGDENGRYRVKATTEIQDFNHAFESSFSEEEIDTVGGLVIRHLGRLPKRGEIIEVDGLRFQVMRADSRRVYTLLVERFAPPEAAAAAAEE